MSQPHLKPYSQYKDSGIDWLGEVPAHWDVISLQGLSTGEKNSFIDGDWIESPYIVEMGIRLIQTGNVGVGEYKEQGFRYISDETFLELNCTEVSPNDVLICRLADPVGRACLAPDLGTRMITSVDVCILKPKASIDARFVVYLLSSQQYLSLMESQCRGGTRDRVSRSFLGSVRIALPASEEQTVIAEFLDRETGKIDALVAEQRRLIDLLKEKRQAVISHAVTKGLNPNAPMKDSGIEWLGEIPAHWEIGKIKHWFSTNSGGTPDTGKRALYYTDENGFPWLRSTDLNNDYLHNYEVAITEQAIIDSVCEMLPEGSVLIAMYGGDGTIGKNALLRFSACINQAVCALMPNQFFESEYTFRYIQFYRPYWMIGAESARKDPNISQALIRNAPMLRPPLGEQKSIVIFLNEKLENFDKLIRQAERAIELLQERRTALISAAVTGKIDVRQPANVLAMA